MTQNSEQIDNQEQVILIQPKQYFQLIQKVGCKGPYQRNIFLIFFLNWFIASLLLMGTSFMFLNPKLDCTSQGVVTSNCENYVCNLPQNQRAKYYVSQGVVSLATEFGPFHCSKTLEIDALRMVLYAGTFFGYIGVLFITDNYGRKFSIVIAWGLTLFGIIILSASMNIQMACIGLFLAGVGCQSGIRISMAVFSEIVDNLLRQKYSVALEIAFGLGQITIGLVYFLIEDWRWVTIGFCLIPGVIQLLLLMFYLEETPKFAIKKNKQNAIKGLNKIGRINLGVDHIITEQDIDRVLQHQVKDTKMRTPLDLCTYKSQRMNFFGTSLIFFCITYLYFGPVIIVSDLGLNIFVTQVVLGVSETIAYPISFIFIQRSPRKLTGYIFFGITAVLFGTLIFVVPPKQCDGCTLAIIQLVLVFIARFCVCYYFSIFFLYVTQIFPTPLRGIGFGMGSAFGAIASTSGQFILPAFQSKGINPMIMFAVCAVICAVTIIVLPETHKRPLPTCIPEQAQAEQLEKERNEKFSIYHGADSQKDGNQPRQSYNHGVDSQRNSTKQFQIQNNCSPQKVKQ